MEQIYISKTNKQGFRSFAVAINWEALTRDPNSIANIFLDQNFKKGPPGRACSPGADNWMPRTILSDADTMSNNYQLSIITISISHNS